jgi:hypothetical protein
MVNACASHGVAAYAQKKGAAWMANQLLIEIDPHIDVVVRRGGKTCGNLVTCYGKAKLWTLEPQRLGWLKRYPIQSHGSAQ